MESVTQVGRFLILPRVSDSAYNAIGLFEFLIVCCGLLTCMVIIALMCMARYKHRDDGPGGPVIGDAQDRSALYSFIPLIICALITIGVLLSAHDREGSTGSQMIVYATEHEASWTFSSQRRFSSSFELYIPVNQLIKIFITDLNGTLFTVWLKAQASGVHHVYGDPMSDATLSALLSRVQVISVEAFKDLAVHSSDTFRVKDQDEPTQSLVEWGEDLYAEHQCDSCHSLEEGAPSSGPSLWKIYGRRGVTEAGEPYIADEAYLRESLLSPQAKVVLNYPHSMPSYQDTIDAEELDALVTYLTTVK